MATGRVVVPNINEEVPFPIEELFFSRTDERGIILSGNSIFQRISMYEWEELLRKPHNLIRHPHMPKVVFKLLWDTIKGGNPIGAYVKNKAKDGRYYWVFAIVTPVEGGFLSVRLKPSSPILNIVEEEYKSLVALESKNKANLEESASVLMERLAQLGFNDYGAFMSAALGTEIAARNGNLKREDDGVISCFVDLLEVAKSLLKQAELIFSAYAKNEYVPLNLRIQSAQLGDDGATIGVISNNYNIISKEIQNNMNQFTNSAKRVLKTINDGLFLMGTAKIQQEVFEFFQKEPASSHFSKEQEMGYLEQQQKAYRQKAVDGLRAIIGQIERFKQDCTEMKRLAAGLEVTRIMGKMEISRLNVIKGGLNELINDLEVFQTTISSGLKDIEQMSRNIQQNMRDLLETVES